jgi:hypothetical protein
MDKIIKKQFLLTTLIYFIFGVLGYLTFFDSPDVTE